MTLYLVYTLLQSLYDVKLAGDFFTLLSVQPTSTDREIKSHFRRLAAKYHPDKLRSTTTVDGTISGETHFLALKLAQDTLLSPTLRYAYTRFGPSITTLSHPENKQPTIQTYVLSGLRYNLFPSYTTNLLSLIGLNYFFLPKWGSYWRYLILSTIFTVELYLLTHSDISLAAMTSSIPLLKYLPVTQIYTVIQTRTKLGGILPPHLLPFQILSILRTLSISMNIFISQLAPSSNQTSTDPSKQMAALLSNLNNGLTHLSTAAARTDAESTSLLQLQLTPYKGNAGKIERLREGMREGVVTGALRARPEVKAAIEKVLERRKVEGRNVD